MTSGAVKKFYFFILMVSVFADPSPCLAAKPPKTTEYQVKIDLLEKLVKELQHNLEMKSSILETLKEEKYRLTEQLGILNTSNDELTRNIIRLTSTIQDLQKQMMQNVSETGSNEAVELKGQLREIKKALKEKEHEIQEVNTKRAGLSQEFLRIKKELAGLQEKKAQTAISAEPIQPKAQKEIPLKDNRLIKLEEENIFLNKRIRQLADKNKEIQDELIFVKNAYLEREGAIPQQIAALSREYKDNIEKLSQALKKSEADITKILPEQKKLQEDNEQLAAANKELRNQVDEFRQKADASLRQRTDLQEQVQALQTQRDDLENQLSQIKVKYEEEIAAFSAQIDQVTKKEQDDAAGLKAMEGVLGIELNKLEQSVADQVKRENSR
ncbi:MAG TPA: hypothetical protein VI749_02855 [Candidatus Omnitrophota bacterium]|nr:hypothetical protein [Candidatus Omnitrophota bacterium]